MMKREVLPIIAALLCIPACTEDPDVSADTDSAGGTAVADDDDESPDDDDDGPSSDSNDSGSTGEPGDTSGVDSSGNDSDSDTADTDDTGEDLPPPPATGIQIVHVTADQAVRVPVALDGELVGGAERTVPLYQGRALMLRAFYELDEGYESRDIYGVLRVQQTDGTETEYGSFITADAKDCDGVPELDCRYGTLPNTFYWAVAPEDVRPGMTYSIELLEAAPGHEDDVSDKVPIFPTDGGTIPVGIEDTYMKMRVVLVPFDHNIGGDCPEPPDIMAPLGDDTDRTVADFFAERLLSQNPADEVEIIPHAVVNYTGSLRNASLLGTLQQMRFQENAPPEYYYYGVARPCDGGPDFAGVAQLGGPSMGQAGQRVGWGVYYSNVGTTAETFVHEIGHEQGRSHIACNGEEAGVDPSYPDHPEGDLLSYGVDVFSPTSFEVHTPSTHDYMTYCSDTWVSEWAYNLVAPWIAEISSWELSDNSAQKVPLLVGTVRADGTEDWYVTSGHAPTQRSDQHAVRFALSGGQEVETPAFWTRWERTEDYNVIVPLPSSLDQITALSWTGEGIAHEIDRTALAATTSLSQ